MILTYKYRLKGKRCTRQLRRFAWAVNQVWNFCVQTQRSVQRTYHDGLSPQWPSPLAPPKIFIFMRREWGCSACGEIHGRDVNAARNILALGLSAQPPAEESRVAHGR